MDRDKSLRHVGHLLGVCLLLSGCAGTLDDPDRFRTFLGGDDTEGGTTDDAAGGGGACGDVPSTIFVKSCATSTCHSTADKAQMLDLEAPNVASRVVGVPATGTTCSGMLADPSNPEKSVLYLRLVGTTCGARMPFASLNPLPSAQIACVKDWIAGLGGGGPSDASSADVRTGNDAGRPDSGNGMTDSGSKDSAVDSGSKGDGGADAAKDSTSDTSKPETGPVVGAGTGLKGEYFDNQDFTSLKLTRTDATVDFDWGAEASPPSIAMDGVYSARWTGKVQAQRTETYTFYANSDDGVALTVNGQELFNDMTGHALMEFSGTIALTAGQSYDIKLEWFNSGGGAGIHLSWSSPNTTKQIIPKSQLTPAP